MRRGKPTRIFAADLETYADQDSDYTYAWASGLAELYQETPIIHTSLGETWECIQNLLVSDNLIIYYHNLKFDGEFWLHFIKTRTDLEESFCEESGFSRARDLEDGEYSYSISAKGIWYSITIKKYGHTVEFRDSYKLLPFSLEVIGKSFDTKHKKLVMEYTSNCVLDDTNIDYFKNDLYVLKEGLEVMYSEGHNKMTIGSCCLSEFKETFLDRRDYEAFFPNLWEEPAPDYTGYKNAGEYIYKSYGGGWCYVNKHKAGKILVDGLTVDVNSLYPSEMHSDSGNAYPYGKPLWFKGEIPEQAKKKNKYYFVRVRCYFRLKEGKLPFIHIRKHPFYRANENLESSDIVDHTTGKAYKTLQVGGKLIDSKATMTFTETEHKLFLECYNVDEYEELDGCYFMSAEGFFDEYLDKYKKIKMTSKGAKRQIAKLFSNNLYGKMAMNDDSSYKRAEIKEDGSIGFISYEQYDKTPGYIAIGSAITANSRAFTIRAAIANYRGGGPGFAYADTDSLHCDQYKESDLVGIPIDDAAYNHWKVEGHWETGLFIRQKTYLEISNGDIQITCAGMPKNSKEMFRRAVNRDTSESEDPNINRLVEENIEYILNGKEITDFKAGLEVPGKLVPAHVKGGIILKETTYKIKETNWYL